MVGPKSTSKERAKAGLEDKIRRLLKEQEDERLSALMEPEDVRTVAGEVYKRLAGPWKDELSPTTMQLYADTVFPCYIAGDPIGAMHPDDVGRHELEDYRKRLFKGRKGKRLSPYSVARYETPVHKYLREIHNPAPDALNPLKKGKPQNVQWLDKKDREQYLNALWPHPERTAAMLHMHGIEMGVACALEWSHYNGATLKIEQQEQEIRGKRRTRKDLKRPARFRTIPVADWLKDHLDELPRTHARILVSPEGFGVLPNNMRRAFRECLKDTPWTNIGAHDLRRSAGKWMLDSGGKLSDVAAILGNDVRVLLMHYDTRDEQGMRDAIEGL